MPRDTQTTGCRYRLGFIGAGNLAGSVIRGLLLKDFCSTADIIASQPVPELRAALQSETGIYVTADNLEVAQSAATILIGVKPAIVLPVLHETAVHLKSKLVVSLAAGIRLSSMEPVAEARFMRVMTNLPSAIGRGASALASGSRTTEEDIASTREIFNALGIVVAVEEDQIDAVTALAGSGPAFIYSVIEALSEGAVNCGLRREEALPLAAQTAIGAAELALTSGHTPDELRKMVVTPGGTTAAGLAAMEKHGTLEGLRSAVEAAAARGREMAQEN